MSYSGTPTLYGEQQIAAAYTSGVRLPVVSIAVGDGNGVAVTPTEGMTALVHEVWRGNITSWGVDPADTRRIVIHTTVPATAGPFTVREAGVYDQNGGLICVTALAATEIVAPGTSNQATSIDLTVALPIGTAGAITVSPTLGERFTVERLYRTPFISINSASVTAPPVSPAIGDLYIVPTGATGAWATATIGTIAEWNDTFWSFLAPPTKMVAGIMDQADGVPSEFLKWTGTAWESFAAAGGIITVKDTAGASTADELVGTASPAITAYQPNQVFAWRKDGDGNATTEPKGNVNGLGDKPFRKADGSALFVGDLPANGDFLTHYDGTSHRVLGLRISDAAALSVTPIAYTDSSVLAVNGQVYTMDLTVQQTFTLPNPATIQPGYRCRLQVFNSPSGFQTAQAVIASGSGPTALSYRGTPHTPFYLIGFGEDLEFNWTGTAFLVEAKGQATSVFVYRSNLPGAGGFVAGTGAAVAIPFSSNSGYPSVFGLSLTNTTVPVSGNYFVVATTSILSQNNNKYTGVLYSADSVAINHNYLNASAATDNTVSANVLVPYFTYFEQGTPIASVVQAPSGLSYNTVGSILSVSLLQR